MLAHASDGALQPGRCRLRVQPCTVGCEPFARTHHRPCVECGMRFASLFVRSVHLGASGLPGFRSTNQAQRCEILKSSNASAPAGGASGGNGVASPAASPAASRAVVDLAW